MRKTLKKRPRTVPVPDVSICVEIAAGASIPGAFPKLIALAEKLGCCVRVELNGRNWRVVPGDDPDDLAQAFYERHRG